MPRFVKKPVEIEARQWDGDVRVKHPLTRWILSGGGDYEWSAGTPQKLQIRTLEGLMDAEPGDWIIKGITGEFYPCKPDIFKLTYEEVSDAE